MNETILVAYATRYGSTRQVAEVVAEELQDLGVRADVRPVGNVADLGTYAGVVLGAPFYIGSMLKDATRFLERYQAALAEMPVAIFALGPVRASDDMAEARQQLDKLLAKYGWLKPVAAEMFVGAYDPAVLRLADKLVTLPPASPLHGVRAFDDRDWGAIRAWAGTLPQALAGEPPSLPDRKEGPESESAT